MKNEEFTYEVISRTEECDDEYWICKNSEGREVVIDSYAEGVEINSDWTEIKVADDRYEKFNYVAHKLSKMPEGDRKIAKWLVDIFYSSVNLNQTFVTTDEEDEDVIEYDADGNIIPCTQKELYKFIEKYDLDDAIDQDGYESDYVYTLYPVIIQHFIDDEVQA